MPTRCSLPTCGTSYAESINKAHERLEIRRCWAIADPVAFEYIRLEFEQNWLAVEPEPMLK
jgi:hypothetical protein